jgi:hypothetical protein
MAKPCEAGGQMTFCGHKNYSYWNVHKWLHESYSNQVRSAIESLTDKDKAARYLLSSLPEVTPDNVQYTFRNIREALKTF